MGAVAGFSLLQGGLASLPPEDEDRWGWIVLGAAILTIVIVIVGTLLQLP